MAKLLGIKNRKEIVMILLVDLHPFDGNAKKHSQNQINLLARGIERFGFNVPIVVDKNKEIVAGHGRYYAAQKLGLKEVPCIEVSDLTDEEVRAYRLADNQINMLTDFDMGLVVEEMRALDVGGFDVTLTGFNSDLLIIPDDNDDVIPENVPPIAKLGDVWALGEHRVGCGDSTSKEAVERLMDGKKADMVFTDPPYGQGFAIIGDTKKEYKEIYRGFVEQMIRVCGENIYICCNFACIGFFIEEAERQGLQMYEKIAWVKNLFGQGRLYHRQHEDILFLGSGKYRKDKRNDDVDVWNVNSMRNFAGNETAKEDVGHPTQKPVAIPERAINNSSIRGELVYDGFLGSGSTLIAAEKTGRICYGMEIDPKYVDVIIRRFMLYNPQAKVECLTRDVKMDLFK